MKQARTFIARSRIHSLICTKLDILDDPTSVQWPDLHFLFTQQPYRQRLILFDRHFELIPFRFPPFDPVVGWYFDPVRTDLLTAIFMEEKSRGPLLYERTVRTGDRDLVFRIAPSQRADRNFFNEFVLQKFLRDKQSIEQDVEARLTANDGGAEYVSERLRCMDAVLRRVPEELRRNPSSLPAKFLQVFYNGVLAPGFEWHSHLAVRRKFIELYLYGQGLLVADHYHWLQRWQARAVSEDPSHRLSLPRE